MGRSPHFLPRPPRCNSSFLSGAAANTAQARGLGSHRSLAHFLLPVQAEFFKAQRTARDADAAAEHAKLEAMPPEERDAYAVRSARQSSLVRRNPALLIQTRGQHAAAPIPATAARPIAACLRDLPFCLCLWLSWCAVVQAAKEAAVAHSTSKTRHFARLAKQGGMTSPLGAGGGRGRGLGRRGGGGGGRGGRAHSG